MTVPVVQVGIVRMTVHHRQVPMPMRMRLPGIDARVMLVLMVDVMAMPVLVLHRLMFVFVVMSLR